MECLGRATWLSGVPPGSNGPTPNPNPTPPRQALAAGAAPLAVSAADWLTALLARDPGRLAWTDDNNALKAGWDPGAQASESVRGERGLAGTGRRALSWRPPTPAPERHSRAHLCRSTSAAQPPSPLSSRTSRGCWRTPRRPCCRARSRAPAGRPPGRPPCHRATSPASLPAACWRGAPPTRSPPLWRRARPTWATPSRPWGPRSA